MFQFVVCFLKTILRNTFNDTDWIHLEKLQTSLTHLRLTNYLFHKVTTEHLPLGEPDQSQKAHKTPKGFTSTQSISYSTQRQLSEQGNHAFCVSQSGSLFQHVLFSSAFDEDGCVPGLKGLGKEAQVSLGEGAERTMLRGYTPNTAW